jgi:RimJ/RimL family protein N-acetyltransferase
MSQFAIETNRLLLRHAALEDIDAVFRLFSNPELMKYWNTLPQTDRSQAQATVERMMARIDSDDGLELIIVLKASGEAIGTCALHNLHAPSRRAEIGYSLDPPFWGKGYMQEALERLVEHAFTVLHLNRLEADIDPANLASARSLERLGFTKEGFMPERWIVGDTFSDTAFYGLLKRTWQARTTPSQIPNQSTP